MGRRRHRCWRPGRRKSFMRSKPVEAARTYGVCAPRHRGRRGADDGLRPGHGYPGVAHARVNAALRRAVASSLATTGEFLNSSNATPGASRHSSMPAVPGPESPRRVGDGLPGQLARMLARGECLPHGRLADNSLARGRLTAWIVLVDPPAASCSCGTGIRAVWRRMRRLRRGDVGGSEHPAGGSRRSVGGAQLCLGAAAHHGLCGRLLRRPSESGTLLSGGAAYRRWAHDRCRCMASVGMSLVAVHVG